MIQDEPLYPPNDYRPRIINGTDYHSQIGMDELQSAANACLSWCEFLQSFGDQLLRRFSDPLTGYAYISTKGFTYRPFTPDSRLLPDELLVQQREKNVLNFYSRKIAMQRAPYIRATLAVLRPLLVKGMSN